MSDEPTTPAVVVDGTDLSAAAWVAAAELRAAGAWGTATDPLYPAAVLAVRERGRVSISTVQRVLRLGYNRAAGLVEAMEAEGLVSPPAWRTGERRPLPALAAWIAPTEQARTP